MSYLLAKAVNFSLFLGACRVIFLAQNTTTINQETHPTRDPWRLPGQKETRPGYIDSVGVGEINKHMLHSSPRIIVLSQ